MTKAEFVNWFRDYKYKIGLWVVKPAVKDTSPYTMGIFRDYKTGEYIVYKNGGTSHEVKFVTLKEQEAYLKLKEVVLEVYNYLSKE